MFSFLTSQIKIAESGILQGFIDYHSHLLPGVDDGFKTAASSMKALSLLEQSGVAEVWFTPHIMDDYPNTPAQLRELYQKFIDRYSGSIRLHLAAEYMIDGQFHSHLEQNDMLLHRDKELLVETSYYNPPVHLKQVLAQIQKAGIFPLLAHPERYLYMTDQDYLELKSNGIRFQMNLPSLIGAYGSEVKHKAEKLLTNRMYDRFGLDLHSYYQLERFLDAKISRKIVKRILTD